MTNDQWVTQELKWAQMPGRDMTVFDKSLRDALAAGYGREAARAIAYSQCCFEDDRGESAVAEDSLRCDAGALKEPIESAAGYLRIPARLTRVGIFSYVNPDGSVTKEFRPPDEVFAKDSLDSLRLAPVTRGHPVDGKGVYPERARAVARGAVGEQIDHDENFVEATLGVFDSDLIAAIKRGDEREVSCGYLRMFDPTPGEYKGERYDGVQRKIRYNHVAIVTKGRAGPDVALRMDAQGKGEIMGVKVKVGDKEFECSQELADALTAQASTAQQNDAAQILAREQARADAAEAQVKQLKDVASKFPEQVKARVALERLAVGAVEAEKMDVLTDRQIKEAVITKAFPELKCDGRDDAYVDGLFTAATQTKQSSASVPGLAAIKFAGQRSDAEHPRDKMIREQSDAWKKENK